MQDKQLSDVDILALPSRSERRNVRKEGELPSRSELLEEKKQEKKKNRSRYRLAKILLCLFIPIPFLFVLYTYNPDIFSVFSRETTSTSGFETVQIARARDEDVAQYMYHTVEEGETIIKEANNLSSEELEPGQQIIIPKKYLEDES